MNPTSITSITFADTLKMLGFLVLGVCFVFYIYHQAQSLITGPKIDLTELDTVQHERLITLTGATQNIVALHLNGKEIYTDENGNFTQPLVLEGGYTILTLTAKDRFGRHTALTKKFVYVPVAM
jgi:hypothetical protein